LLIYGAFTETSIGKLFLAGIIPGMLAALLFMLWIGFASWRNPSLAPEPAPEQSLGRAVLGLVHIWPLLALIGAVLGSLFAGLATPTESAGVGVLGAIVIGYLAGDLNLRGILKALMNTLVTFCVIGMVFMGAVILAQSISVLGLPQELLRQVTGLGIGSLGILAMIVLLYIVMGMIFDGLSMMIMTLPVVFPLLVGLGYDPVWLGVLITLLIEIGMLTPPVGMNLYVLTGMTNGQVKLGQAAVAALPYWLALLFLILLIVAFPGIVTWLPSLASL
jgi:C4-dicarboxylate transporter, DctM subunit